MGSVQDLVERLAVRDVEKREQRIGDLQHEFDAQCTVSVEPTNGAPFLKRALLHTHELGSVEDSAS
eukprot:6207452-Amphidinium_carterae.2